MGKRGTSLSSGGGTATKNEDADLLKRREEIKKHEEGRKKENGTNRRSLRIRQGLRLSIRGVNSREGKWYQGIPQKGNSFN